MTDFVAVWFLVLFSMCWFYPDIPAKWIYEIQIAVEQEHKKAGTFDD